MVPKKLFSALRNTWGEALKYNKKRDAWTTIQQARALISKGPDSEAYDFLNTAVRRFPDNAEIRLLYASVVLPTHPEEGVLEVVKAVELEPNEPNRLARAADLIYSMGHIELAREYASAARDYGGTNFLFSPELTRLEADLALRDGDKNAAESGYRSAVQLEPHNEALSLSLAKFLAKQGRRGEAVQELERALRVGTEESGVQGDELARLRDEIREGRQGS